jgi:YbbR domain-containing protein
MKLVVIKNNLWAKISAVILAIGLWLYIAGEETIEVELNLPLNIEIGQNMVVSEQKAELINVYARGRKELISKLAEEKLASNIDLTSYKERTSLVIPIERKNLPFEPDVDVMQIRPEKVELKIDRLIQKVLPIRVITEGEPAPGYEVEGFIIDPISAMVRGPEDFIDNLVYIDTEPVDVTGRQKSFKRYVSLKDIPMFGNKVPPQSIEVVVKIAQRENKSIKKDKK